MMMMMMIQCLVISEMWTRDVRHATPNRSEVLAQSSGDSRTDLPKLYGLEVFNSAMRRDIGNPASRGYSGVF